MPARRARHNGDNPQMETATKPETAIEKGMAGPGLLAYIATSKFSEYLPFYRIEDIFARQGFEIPRATQSVWCGDMADLFEPLWELMAEGVRASHVVATDDTIMPMLATGKTANARMWVYVGDDDHPYNVFDFTLNRGRDGPKYFLRDYSQVLSGRCLRRLQRRGCRQRHHARRMLGASTAPFYRCGEGRSRDRPRGRRNGAHALCGGEAGARRLCRGASRRCARQQSAPMLAQLREKLLLWKEQLLPKHPMAEAINYALSQWQELNVFCSDGAVASTTTPASAR